MAGKKFDEAIQDTSGRIMRVVSRDGSPRERKPECPPAVLVQVQNERGGFDTVVEVYSHYAETLIARLTSALKLAKASKHPENAGP